MEAALTLKTRGFARVIFEKSDVLGGQLNIADKPLMKEKLAAYKESLIYRTEHAGIEIRLNTKADVDTVKSIHPCELLYDQWEHNCSTNSRNRWKQCNDSRKEVLTGKKTPTGTVAVIGGRCDRNGNSRYISSQGT